MVLTSDLAWYHDLNVTNFGPLDLERHIQKQSSFDSKQKKNLHVVKFGVMNNDKWIMDQLHKVWPDFELIWTEFDLLCKWNFFVSILVSTSKTIFLSLFVVWRSKWQCSSLYQKSSCYEY